MHFVIVGKTAINLDTVAAVEYYPAGESGDKALIILKHTRPSDVAMLSKVTGKAAERMWQYIQEGTESRLWA